MVPSSNSALSPHRITNSHSMRPRKYRILNNTRTSTIGDEFMGPNKPTIQRHSYIFYEISLDARIQSIPECCKLRPPTSPRAHRDLGRARTGGCRITSPPALCARATAKTISCVSIFFWHMGCFVWVASWLKTTIDANSVRRILKPVTHCGEKKTK